MATSRNIPNHIKRHVRQRCGYGCVICGFPIYEYDHIEDFAVVDAHDEVNLTLLCDLHHKQKTNGLLSKAQVLKANLSPFNKFHSYSSKLSLMYEGEICQLVIGRNFYYIRNDNKAPFYAPFLIDGFPIISFRFENNNLLINILMLDENGTMVLIINENQLIYNTSLWDIEFIANNLIIRKGARKIYLDIYFHPPIGIRIKKAFFWFRGKTVEVKNDDVIINSPNLKDVRFSDNSWLNPTGGIAF